MVRRALPAITLGALLVLAACTPAVLSPVAEWEGSPGSPAARTLRRPLSPPVRVALTAAEPATRFFEEAAGAADGWTVMAPRRLPQGFVLDHAESRYHSQGLRAVYRRGGALLVIRESSSPMGDVGDDPDASPAPLGPFPGTLFLDITGDSGGYGYAVVTDQRQGHYYLGTFLLPAEQVRAIAASMAEVR